MGAMWGHQEKGKNDLSDLDGLNTALYGLMVFYQANLPCFKPISPKSSHIKPHQAMLSQKTSFPFFLMAHSLTVLIVSRLVSPTL